MITKFRSERSLHGYALDVLKSGLQKYIRRGMYDKAVYCAGELDSFADVEGGERIRTNMIHRLMIIYLEDIGLGNYKLWNRTGELVELLLTERKKVARDRAAEIQSLKQIIWLLCSAKKTRACSFIRAWTKNNPRQLYQSKQVNFEDAIKRKDWIAFNYFFDMWEENKKDVLKIMRGTLCGKGSVAEKWYKEIKTSEQFLTLLLPLAEHIFGSKNDELKEDSFMCTWDELSQDITFDEYVYDKHVRGKGNKTTSYFRTTSSIVNNEVFILPKEFNDSYLIAPRELVETPKENKVDIVETVKSDDTRRETYYTFLCRAQISCSNAKTDTYFARDPDQKMVFVKGPYTDITIPEDFLKFQDLKREKGMPYIRARVEMMIPDRWPEGVPLGLRRKLDLKKAYPFLICDSLFGDTLKTKIVESKVWPPTEVVDCPKFDPLKYSFNSRELKDWYESIEFRVKYNLGDLANRNFIPFEGRIYSVDEEVTKSKKINLENCLKKQRYELYMSLKKYYEPKDDAARDDDTQRMQYNLERIRVLKRVTEEDDSDDEFE